MHTPGAMSYIGLMAQTPTALMIGQAQVAHAQVRPLDGIDAAQADANAERIRDTWNACEGIDSRRLALGCLQREREALRVAMHACAQAACYFEATQPHEHGQRALGETWSEVYGALLAAREALGFNRRFVFELGPDSKTYDLIDKEAGAGRRCVMRGYSLAETLVMADQCNAENVTPLELPRARTMRCSCCGADTMGRPWWNRDTGYSLCGTCRDWFDTRSQSTYETARGYGVRGIHYDARA